MSLKKLLLTLGLCLGLLSRFSITTTAQPTPDPLLELFSRSPSVLMGEKGMFSYLNFRALEAAHEYVRPSSWGTLGQDNPDGNWGAMMLRVHAGGEFLNYARILGPAMLSTVGFDLFDLQQAVEIGAPPSVGIIFGGAFDPEAMDKALKARGFESQIREGITVWNRFEDGRMSIKDVERGDPFGGHLGMAARIGFFPGYLANARSWAVFDEFMEVHQGRKDSMLTHPGYGLIAQALTDPQVYAEPVIQLLIFPVAGMPPLRRELTDGKTAPLYIFAALADRQDGDLQRHELILVYQTEAEANAAAPVVLARLEEDSARVDAGASFEFLPPRIVTAEDGGAALILSVRYPWVKELLTGGSLQRQAGILFSSWVNRAYRMDFAPLVRGE